MRTIMDALLADYSAGQWLLVFFLYSMAGWCWEVALSLVQERKFVNRGFLSGPLLPVYGFGAMSILLTCIPLRRHIFMVAAVGMAVASVLEYAVGWLLEMLFHVRLWDYSAFPYHLNGYVCLYSCAVWALFSVMVVCVIHPLGMPLIRRIPPVFALALSAGLAAFALGDAVLSVCRALDMRALLELMERAAEEMQAFDMDVEGTQDARMAQRIRRADRIIRRNPRAASRRHSAALASFKEKRKT